ncbi:protein of unknown function [Reichenbachiella agariperforans]|uniref:DUF4837 domain-containing protein n=1 Tax=Reichenbachiella agariperforans TaxID=156994 RepID=A0A1M6TQ84_REIAG|nr:DUF4837 family protein [Reichenbachiella agariperforans]SHK59145.1 protein of unknown function [Reichenbachiella agariperforans]
MSKLLCTLTLLTSMSLLVACSNSSDQSISSKKDSDKTYLPKAGGEPNAVLVVMDTTDWSGEIGESLRDIFSAYVPGLPQDEPYFKVRNINPLKFNSIIKRATNVIFVHTLDSRGRQSYQMSKYYSEATVERIKKDSSIFMLPQTDVYAKGQNVLHLFGQTKTQLIKHIQDNQSTLRNHFLKIENDRVASKIFKVREKQIEKRLEEDHDFTLNIPYGYELAKNLKDFVWIRQLDTQWEKDIFVYFRPYDNQEPFEDVMAYRESITSMYMRDIQKPEIYMTLQDTLGYVKEVNFKGRYAKEARGLWKYSDISAGGPFVSYTFVDEEQKRIYYLEGYVFNPGEDKRVPMQEMEVILQSFTSNLSL